MSTQSSNYPPATLRFGLGCQASSELTISVSDYVLPQIKKDTALVKSPFVSDDVILGARRGIVGLLASHWGLHPDTTSISRPMLISGYGVDIHCLMHSIEIDEKNHDIVISLEVRQVRNIRNEVDPRFNFDSFFSAETSEMIFDKKA